MSHIQNKFVPTCSMSSQDLELYNRILAFEIDKPDVSFPFSQRLARDKEWSLNYAQRVINEYKKFLFLAIAAGHPVTPSVAVDEAWHLHLTYTHSYWDELCAEILHKPLHHNPTQGGASQRELFWNNYINTLASYERFFGSPPADIWPQPKIRFSKQYERASYQEYRFLLNKIFQKVSWKMPHLLWTLAFLVFSLTLSWHFFISQSVVAQVSSPPNSVIAPSFPQTIQQWIMTHQGWAILLGLFIVGFLLKIFGVDSDSGGGNSGWGGGGGDSDCSGDSGCGGCGCGD